MRRCESIFSYILNRVTLGMGHSPKILEIIHTIWSIK